MMNIPTFLQKAEKINPVSCWCHTAEKVHFNNRAMKDSAINHSVKLAYENPVTISIAINVVLGPHLVQSIS